jgi:hypothetical protein
MDAVDGALRMVNFSIEIKSNGTSRFPVAVLQTLNGRPVYARGKADRSGLAEQPATARGKLTRCRCTNSARGGVWGV